MNHIQIFKLYCPPSIPLQPMMENLSLVKVNPDLIDISILDPLDIFELGLHQKSKSEQLRLLLEKVVLKLLAGQVRDHSVHSISHLETTFSMIRLKM
jgi:hypothetical protein